MLKSNALKELLARHAHDGWKLPANDCMLYVRDLVQEIVRLQQDLDQAQLDFNAARQEASAVERELVNQRTILNQTRRRLQRVLGIKYKPLFNRAGQRKSLVMSDFDNSTKGDT